MNGSIDPYLDWLQIPRDRRPPTHYDLLGLRAFESTEARIRSAAIERIAHVRKYQVGVHGELAIRIMGEISRALTCLTDAAAKQQYDAQLGGQKTVVDAAPPKQETVLQEPFVAATIVDEPPAVPVETSPEPKSESNARFLIIVGVGFAAALALMFLGGWILTRPKQPDRQGVVARTLNTTPNGGASGRGAIQSRTVPAQRIPTSLDRKAFHLIDVFISTEPGQGTVHLLLDHSQGLVEGISQDLRIAVGMNNLRARRETNGLGDMLDISGELEPDLPRVFADASSSLRMTDVQRPVGGLQTAPMRATHELTFLHRIRPPLGTLVEFEAIYQGLDPGSLPDDAKVQLKASIFDQRTPAPLRFAMSQAKSQIETRFYAGQTVLVQAAIAQGESRSHLELTGIRMVTQGNPSQFIGAPTPAVRVHAVMRQWNDLTATLAITPGTTADLSAALATLNWTAPQPVASPAPMPPPAVVTPQPTTPPASTPTSSPPAPSPMPETPQRSYYGFVVPDPVNGIIRTHPERTIADHGTAFTEPQYDLTLRQDGRMLQTGTYHLFKIPAKGVISFTWSGASTSKQIGMRYWNDDGYNAENIPGGQGSVTRTVAFTPQSGDKFGYVMINAPTGTLSTDYFKVQTSATSTRPQPSPPKPAPAAVKNVPPSPQLMKALAAVDDAIDKAQKSKSSNTDTWSEVVSNLSNLESQATAKVELDEVKRLRRRLTSLAADRLAAAVKIRNKNPDLFNRFIDEAEALDPYGDIGRRAGELRAQGSGF